MSTSGGICLSLQASTMCPEFANYKAFIQAGVPITTISAFDNSVQQGYGLAFKDIVTRSTSGGYNCKGWKGENLRYMHSVLCAYYVGLGFQYGAAGSSTPCNSGTPRLLSLCSSSFDAFANSWDAIMDDNAICPTGVSPSSQRYKAMLVNAKRYASGDPTCMAGVLEENYHCGFQSSGEATEFCANPNNVAANACCVQFLPSSAQVTTSVISTLSALPNLPLSATSTKALPVISFTVSTGDAALPLPSSLEMSSLIPSTFFTAPNAGNINIAPLASPPMTSSSQESSTTTSSSPKTLVVGLIVGFVTVTVAVLVAAGAFYLRRKRDEGNSDFPDGLKLSKIMINGSFTRLKQTTPLTADAAEIGVTDSSPSAHQKYQSTSRNEQQREHQNVCIAALSFIPKLHDEISIEVGDKIALLQIFDDGWAMGYSFRVKQIGIFPQECLFEPGAATTKSLKVERVSSLNNSSRSTTLESLSAC
ncbi:hypothetical protein BC830DRAFT_1128165 [Chytriomyces sp. MP71]|nr:hypothetical protein BC830DRAFT_1128165 [Chytriomyces sp. MP71]